MNEYAMRFRVGIFILAALILLAVLVILFGGLPTIFQTFNQYTVVFADAPGVAAGTPVRRSGVRIGEVKNVDLDDATGKVRVHVLIERNHTLRRGDRAVIVHGLLGGDTTLDFLPQRTDVPPGERPALGSDEELVGDRQSDVQTLLTQTSDLVPSTERALNDMRKSLQRYERMAPDVENTVKEIRRTNEELQVTVRNWGKVGERVDVLLQTNQDKLVKSLDNLNETVVRVGAVFSPENQRNLSTTLKNVRTGTDNLESISRNTNELLQQSRQTIQRVNDSVKQADEVMANLQRATKPLAERSDNVMRNLDESADKLNRLMSALTQGNGTFRQIMNDPALYNNLNDAACMLVRIMPRLDRIMRDIEVFADKVARHPESLGVGGVVSPSSGLKEAPNSQGRWPR